MNQDSAAEIVHAIIGDNLVHLRDGKGPGTCDGGLQNPDVVKVRNGERDSRLLHFAVECRRGYPCDLDLGVQRPVEDMRIAPVDVHHDTAAIRKQLHASGQLIGAQDHVGA